MPTVAFDTKYPQKGLACVFFTLNKVPGWGDPRTWEWVPGLTSGWVESKVTGGFICTSRSLLEGATSGSSGGCIHLTPCSSFLSRVAPEAPGAFPHIWGTGGGPGVAWLPATPKLLVPGHTRRPTALQDGFDPGTLQSFHPSSREVSSEHMSGYHFY